MKHWEIRHCSPDFWEKQSASLSCSLSRSLRHSTLLQPEDRPRLPQGFCLVQTQERDFPCIVSRTCCERLWLWPSEVSGGCLCEGLIHGCRNMMWWVDACEAVHLPPPPPPLPVWSAFKQHGPTEGFIMLPRGPRPLCGCIVDSSADSASLVSFSLFTTQCSDWLGMHLVCPWRTTGTEQHASAHQEISPRSSRSQARVQTVGTQWTIYFPVAMRTLKELFPTFHRIIFNKSFFSCISCNDTCRHLVYLQDTVATPRDNADGKLLTGCQKVSIHFLQKHV